MRTAGLIPTFARDSLLEEAGFEPLVPPSGSLGSTSSPQRQYARGVGYVRAATGLDPVSPALLIDIVLLGIRLLRVQPRATTRRIPRSRRSAASWPWSPEDRPLGYTPRPSITLTSLVLPLAIRADRFGPGDRRSRHRSTTRHPLTVAGGRSPVSPCCRSTSARKPEVGPSADRVAVSNATRRAAGLDPMQTNHQEMRAQRRALRHNSGRRSPTIRIGIPECQTSGGRRLQRGYGEARPSRVGGGAALRR